MRRVVQVPTANLVNQLRDEFVSIRLAFKDGTVELAERSQAPAARILALIGEIETANTQGNRLPASFVVHGVSLKDDAVSNSELVSTRIQAVEAFLMQQGKVPVERILPGIVEATEDPGKVGVYVEVVDPEF